MLTNYPDPPYEYFLFEFQATSPQHSYTKYIIPVLLKIYTFSFPQYFCNSVYLGCGSMQCRIGRHLVGMNMDCEQIFYIITGICNAEFSHIPVFNDVSPSVFYTFVECGIGTHF